MEEISNAGNGNYFYIDNIMEAEKVFAREIRATLFTIAKDVKLQIEFNPAKVQAYRLIGYENRVLAREDFNDDRKDAGELGAGHTVTALYEIIPVGVESPFVRTVDAMKYQKPSVAGPDFGAELLTLKLRYKQPDAETSRLLVTVVKDEKRALARTSDNFRFSAAVAAFGMLLRDSEFKGSGSYAGVLELARNAQGEDPGGYRSEFLQLVKKTALLALN